VFGVDVSMVCKTHVVKQMVSSLEFLEACGRWYRMKRVEGVKGGLVKTVVNVSSRTALDFVE
jgi:hypothetical protein